MTRAERYEQVRALRAEGLLLRQIAERLGISRSYVGDLLADPGGERLRRRHDRARSRCADCGAVMSWRGANSGSVPICKECRRPVCGTSSAYSAGCRCDECRAANREAHELWRVRVACAVPERVHGTYNGYVNYYCRCARCRAAGSEANRRARLRRQEVAS